MNGTCLSSDSNSYQHLSKSHTLQNAPLVLLSQVQDIARYGPLAPYMSLRKDKDSSNVPLFDIEASRVPEWTYNHLPPPQRTAFGSPVILGGSDLYPNNQLRQPLAALHSTLPPLSQQELVRRSMIAFHNEPLPTVSCRSDVNSDSYRSNTRKNFSYTKMYGNDYSEHLGVTQFQHNNDFHYVRHPHRNVGKSAAYIATSGNSASNHLQLYSENRRTSHAKGNLYNSLYTCHEPNKEYMCPSMEIMSKEELLNLIVKANQNSNQLSTVSSTLPLLASSFSSPPESSPISPSMTSKHPLSVSSLSKSAYTRASPSTSDCTLGHKRIKLDQPDSHLAGGCSCIRCKCYSSTTGNDKSNKYISNWKHKKYDRFSRHDNLSEANQRTSCDMNGRNLIESGNTIDTQHTAFRIAPGSIEYTDDHHNTVGPVQENGNYSGQQRSSIRMDQMKDNLHPSFGTPDVEGGFVSRRKSGGLQRNHSNDKINSTNSSHYGWKDNQEPSAFRNTTTLHFQRERDQSYSVETETTSSKRNEGDMHRPMVSVDPLGTLRNAIPLSNQTMVNSTKEFNLNRYNGIYSSSRIRPVKILVGSSQNGGDINPRISSNGSIVPDESRQFINRSQSVRQSALPLVDDNRKESQIHHPFFLSDAQEEEPNELEVSRTMTAHCVSTITDPSEFSAASATESIERMNREPGDKKYFYDLSTRDVVSHSPTNSDRDSPYLSEANMSASDKQIDTCSGLPLNMAYHPNEPRSSFSSTSGKPTYNQMSEEENDQIQESLHNTIHHCSESDEILTNSTPITIVGLQTEESVPHTEISQSVVRTNEDNILMTNGNENHTILSSAADSIASGDKSVTSTEASKTNAKDSVPVVPSDPLEVTNDSSNVFPQCVYCENRFSSTELLQEHLKSHMVTSPYQCSHCSLGFVSKARLLRHEQLHMNAKPYKCEECNNLFSTVTAFHRHLHSKRHNGKNLFECKECGLSFINEAYANLHYKTHTGEHPFQCEQCGNIFACKNNLKNHIMTHTGEKPYQCVHCAKRFVTNFSLKVHTRTHTKEYPYTCDICNKRFLCSSNMTSHARTHTGEKRHQCYKCGKFLSSWSGLQSHQRTHTKECPFSCDTCSKSFSSKFSLRIHHRIHSGENPHKCKHCDKCFSNSSNLQRHIRTHTGEKPYCCTYCNKAFCSSTYLKSHIRTHTGEKPHTCKFCGKGFSNTSCFKQHVKNHEKGYEKK